MNKTYNKEKQVQNEFTQSEMLQEYHFLHMASTPAYPELHSCSN